jgi:hypothetical protein
VAASCTSCASLWLQAVGSETFVQAPTPNFKRPRASAAKCLPLCCQKPCMPLRCAVRPVSGQMPAHKLPVSGQMPAPSLCCAARQRPNACPQAARCKACFAVLCGPSASKCLPTRCQLRCAASRGLLGATSPHRPLLIRKVGVVGANDPGHPRHTVRPHYHLCQHTGVCLHMHR